MGDLEKLVYTHTLNDVEEDKVSWDKETVQYALHNKKKIMHMINNMIRRYKNLCMECDDIYQESIKYLAYAKDYDINEAIARSMNGVPTSLEGYVSSCIKFCILKNVSSASEDERFTVHESIISSDDEELNIFDTIADPRAEISIDDLDEDLDKVLNMCEVSRYKFGPDIYLVMYVRLLTDYYNKASHFHNVLSVLGIDKKELDKVEHVAEDSEMMMMAKAVCSSGVDEALSAIENYVYGADSIKKVVMNI